MEDTRTSMTIEAKSKEAGYSLIEVIIGVGLLSVIAMAIVGLFVQGRKDVESGKKLTAGLSICQHVAEDLDSLPYTALYGSWGTAIADTKKRAVVVIKRDAGVWKVRMASSVDPNPFDANAAGTQPTEEVAETTWKDFTTAGLVEPVKSMATAWGTELETMGPQAGLRILFQPTFDFNDDEATPEPTTPYPMAQFNGAAFIRMDVAVYWVEATRTRWVSLPQVRTLNEL
jgi:type II secretory pathway pseudopilin PulG